MVADRNDVSDAGGAASPRSTESDELGARSTGE
jgi:hypothetical protein